MINYKYKNYYINFDTQLGKIRLSTTPVQTALQEFDIPLKSSCTTSTRDINSIKLNIVTTNDCNFACKYCYEKDIVSYQERNNFSITKYLETLLFFQKKFPNSKIDLNFFGGEPLLKYNDINFFISKIKNNSNINSINIITNGYIINQDIAHFLYDNFTSITFSLDGLEHIHNENRTLKNGVGTFNRVIKSIETINSVNVNEKLQLYCELTLTEAYLQFYNKNLIKMTFDLLHRLKFNMVAIIPEYSLQMVETRFDLVAQNIVDCYFEMLMTQERIFNIPIINGVISKIFFSSSYTSQMCGAGRNYFSINGKGEVYPCQVIQGKDGYLLGNINGDIKNECLFPAKSGHHLCRNCEYIEICSVYCSGSMCNSNVKYYSSCQFFKLIVKNTVKKIVQIIEQGDKDALIKAIKRHLTTKNEVCRTV